MKQKVAEMMSKLPPEISAYFEADGNGSDAISLCFTDDAIVVDEGKTFAGHEAIRQWKSESSKKYSYTVQPFACESDGANAVVSARVVGSFPGSPIDLRYVFRMSDGKVASLEIKP